MSLNIVSRAEWGARKPENRQTIHLPTPRLWVHHTAGEQHGVKGVRFTQAFHMDTRGFADVAYSFLVDDDGTIYEGRGVGIQGGHTAGDNSSSHAVCALGNYDVRPPTKALVKSIADLARHGREHGWWGDITGGHRDAKGSSTACPGRHLYAALPHIKALAAMPTTPQEDDDVSPELERMIREVHAEVVQREDENLWGLVRTLNHHMTQGDGRIQRILDAIQNRMEK